MSAPTSQAPIILKPTIHNKENITTKWLQKNAFNHPYYLSRTGNWEAKKLKPILRIIKGCAANVLTEKQHLLNNSLTNRFPEQSEDVIREVYEAFLRELKDQFKDPKKSEEDYSIIMDMLASTENLGEVPEHRRWLFSWSVNERGKFNRRKTKAQESKHEKRKRPLRVQELVNEDERGDEPEDEPEDGWED